MKKRQAVIIITTIVVVLVALAILMHLFPFRSSSGPSDIGVAPLSSSSNLSSVVWHGCDAGFCFYVLGDGSGVGVKDGKVVLRVTPGELLEVLESVGGATHYFDGRNGLSYFGGRLEVKLDYGRKGLYSIPADNDELIEKIWSALAGKPLTTLNGTIVSLDGEEITEQLWSRMRDYDANDPAIVKYIEWLREALSPEPHDALNVPWYPPYKYYWFNSGIYYRVRLADVVWGQRTGNEIPTIRQTENDTVLCTGYLDESDPNHYKLGPRACLMPLHPRLTKVVRIGFIKLGFGAGLIVTAYQSGDSITIVVHGTIVNETEWKELLARVYASSFSYYTEKNLNVSTKWILWRILLKGEGSELKTGNTSIPVRQVIVLLEMPAYYFTYTYKNNSSSAYYKYLEGFYWDVVGHPALSLAIHLAYPENADPVELYSRMVETLTWNVVLTGVHHPGDIDETMYSTPFLIRESSRGVCNEQSRSTSLFASNALGAYTAYLTVPDHAISLLLYSSGSTIDVDKDGDYEGKVIVDTAHLPSDYVNTHIEEVDYEPPLLYVDPYYSEPLRYSYFYTGVAYAVLELPCWLKAPWLEYAMEKSNFTRIEEEAWNDTVDYCYKFLNYLPEWRRAVDESMHNQLHTMPPSMALALSKAVDHIPLVYEAKTPPLRQANCTSVYEPGQPGGGTGGGSNVIELPPADVNLVINATWNGHSYNGSVTVNGTRILVLVWEYGGEWVAEVWIGNQSAYSGPVGWSLPDRLTLYFTYSGTTYNITVNIIKEGGNGNSSGESKTTTINVTVQLTPVYTDISTPWGLMPVFDGFRGAGIANATNITVEAFYYGENNYDVHIYVNSSHVYSISTYLPATVTFKHGGIEYEISIELPKPPVLNEAITVELIPVDSTQVVLPNGTVINVTIYMVNQTISIDNATIVVYGYVSRLQIDLDVWVFGVPPANYTVSVESLNATTTMDYAGALHAYIHYQAPENQPIPINTIVKIAIQPLDLIMIILLNG